MRISDINYIDGCTGEVLTELSAEDMFNREVVRVEQTEGSMIIWTVLAEDLPMYWAFEYGKTTEMRFKDFLDECFCYGGDWTSMVLSGLQIMFPKVYDAIPDDKVIKFYEICELLEMCGIIFD